MHFLANRAEILYGDSGDCHLSIGIENLGFGPYLLFSIFGP